LDPVTPVVNILERNATIHQEVVAAMRDPAFYSPAPPSVEVRETHASIVFLAGDRAYKVKKPVRFEFLDYSILPRRRKLCTEEVRLNRRLAPGLYRGVRSIVRTADGFALGPEDASGAVEYAVEMRRFDERRTLASRLARHHVDREQIGQIAARLAAFHAEAEVVDPAADPRRQLKRTSGETFTSLFELVPADLQAAVIAAERYTGAYLIRRAGDFLERALSGLVRDGHGDLRAEHVLLEHELEIVDCVEFDPGLRRIDVASDLAFLVMDLHRLGAPDLAAELVAAYRASGGDPGDDGLVAFYAAQRAWVRAKVELLRANQLELLGEPAGPAREAAHALLSLGRRFAWASRQPLLIVICGLSGSGKSHLAGALSAQSGFPVISSDVVRKRLAGINPLQRAEPEQYTSEFSEKTYAELGRLARAELERGGTVIVDATFRGAADRRAFAGGGTDLLEHARFVECLTPRELRLRRTQRRAKGPATSDATPGVAAAQTFEALTELPASRHLPLRTDRAIESCVAAVESWLDSPGG
jgi:aminoglycoside phosphotransferase family enzyme/predicted kinase